VSVRILVNATILNNPRPTGLGVYTAAVLPRLLVAFDNDVRVTETVLIGDPERIAAACGDLSAYPGVVLRRVTTNHPIHRLIALNRAVLSESRGKWPVLFYSPTHHGVITGMACQVITVHDLFARLFPHNYRMQSWYFKMYLPRVLAKTSKVIVDSAATAADLRRFYPAAPSTSVVHLAARSDMRDTPVSEIAALSGRRFFLFVGPSYPYKNCERLIEAFVALPRTGDGVALVFVGGRASYVERLQRQAAALKLESADVVFLEYVSPGELVWLYRQATALMITTLYEGFGLPALEAMQCDCPVVASRRGSLPEVCGEAALYVDPEDVRQITDAMAKLASDDATSQTLIAAGRRNLTRFSWDVTASKVAKAITACIR